MSLASLAHAEQPEQVIDVQHDDHRGATCWIIPGTGISCLPDSQLKQPATGAAPQRRDRANPTSTPTPHKAQESYQL